MSIYITDTETTGFGKEAQVIQLSYIQINDNKKALFNYDTNKPIHTQKPEEVNTNPEIVQKVHLSNYNPTVKIHPAAQAVHGLSKLKLSGCPLATKVSFPEDAKLIIGHKISFDISMLKKTALHVEQIPTICTIALTKKIENIQNGKFGLQNYKLMTMFEFWYPKLAAQYRTKAHNALADCEMTLLVLIKLWENFPFINSLVELQKYFFEEK